MFNRRFIWSTSALILAIVCSDKGQAEKPFEWRTAQPEEVGISSEKLQTLTAELAKRQTKAFLVVRHDKLIWEWYSPDHGPDKKHYTASLAKAIVGGIALALALDDGYLRLDDPVSRYVTQWLTDPRKSKITVRHLGSHTSGLDDSRPNEEAPWKDVFWRRESPPRDPFTISRDVTPLLFNPGERFHYSNPGIAMLTYVIAAAMRSAPENNIRNLLRDRVYRPIGLNDDEWSIGYGQTFQVDGLPLVPAWGGANFTARATARIGRLVLHRGHWEGRQIISEDSIAAVTQSAGLPGDCGMGWWTNAGRRFPFLPADAVWGAGAGDQILLVIPSLDLVVVRYGSDLGPQAASQENVGRYLFQPFTQVIMPEAPSQTGSSAPYPPSPVIRSLRRAPSNEVIRLARGSDNWPITWGDDDRLYTAYGDGRGFELRVPQKLSLGLAVVTGFPPRIMGRNIRAPALEQYGSGARGKKASGLLMVDGVLYMLVRNAGNAQLAYSRDRGATWEWAPWKFTTSFGCPTFLNFEPNYTGARDGYVYIYSPDVDDAYSAADQMVLARVPKHAILEQSAYEYFVGLDSNQNPIWSKNIADRGPVFRHPGHCWRTGITYNVALKRYIWFHVYPKPTKKDGPSVTGGCGVYDAPEPWGPWTIAFHTEKWDIDPGESGCFPTKWMDQTGKSMWLVFSGEDSFSIRQVEVTLRESGKGAK
ncbi:serine hydrolase [Thermogutta sp.]|uniref:serine hydrolase n=2 Tax=Thermogutta sp. TaxID=1962930 RepID=UPI0032205512